MLTGVNIEATVKLAREIKMPVIASGGIASIDDITQLVPHEDDGIIGAIAGRALYEGTLDFKAALKAAKGAEVARRGDRDQRRRDHVAPLPAPCRSDLAHGPRQTHHPLPRHRRRAASSRA